MFSQSQGRRWRKTLLSGAATLALGAGALVSISGTSQAAGTLPCDIYATAGTPCVAAHSTTRALYGAYNGSLYQVRRSSDNTTLNIGVLSAGGYANAAAQDTFCSGTTCVITVIYDQSGRGNNLTQAPAGGAAGGPDNLANATAAPTTLNGHKAYGVYVAAGTGYRDNSTSGIATGNNPEGEYAIFDGTHYNAGCCFDYGNAETDSHDDGNGTMEAIYFGNIKVWGFGSGNGPWIMADLENGLFSGVNAGLNSADPTINHRYTTAMIKGGANLWAIKGGNAQSGSLSTFYSGARPNVSGYNPMKKQGAIILGIGGDNSKSSAGTFYEGVLTSGYPTDATDNSVQADIVAAGYGAGGTSTPNPFTPGARLSIQATTAGFTNNYLQHDASDTKVVIAPVTSTSTATVKADATWIVTAGLSNSSCVSFQSANASGQYLRHSNLELYLNTNDGTTLFAQDATFCPVTGNSGTGYSFQSVNYPTKYIRHYNSTVYIASDGGTNAWDSATSWAPDTSWLSASPWS
jgi:non-reducing end alpha-L-arabinofuranosidase